MLGEGVGDAVGAAAGAVGAEPRDIYQVIAARTTTAATIITHIGIPDDAWFIAPLAAEEALEAAEDIVEVARDAAAALMPPIPARTPELESKLPRPEGRAAPIESFCEANVLAIEDASCQAEGSC